MRTPDDPLLHRSLPTSADLLTPEWQAICDALDFAFQPIVNVHTGHCLGYECLLRGTDEAGFRTIWSLFDRAHEERALHSVDLVLRQKAITKFTTYPGYKGAKLFYNLDIRVLDSPAYSPGATKQLLESFGLSPGSMCFEISEQQRIFEDSRSKEILAYYHDQGFSIAIDDYGIGFSGLQRLYECETHYLKIDGFFLSDIATSNRKKLLVAHVVGLAHVLGIRVIAEHIMTEEQFYACRSANCDYVQGFLVGHPVLDAAKLQPAIDIVNDLNARDKRAGSSDKRFVLEQVESIEPIPWNSSMGAVLEAFRMNAGYDFVPVINALNEPLGVIWEQDIKEFVYSRYGRELMTNPIMKDRLLEFVSKCPLADVGMGLEKMLQVFSNATGARLLLLTEGSQYRGFLSASALLLALNEKNIAIARDQNPLSRLPGNSLIAEYMGQALVNEDTERIFAYFDLDNFKAFNDVYGFRQGDRAILLLADGLKEAAHGRGVFVGHIGGDDLFAGFTGPEWTLEGVTQWAADVVRGFNQAVLPFFSPEDRARGHIIAPDRSGTETAIPLLSVSCAILVLPAGAPSPSADSVGVSIARCKTAAKRSPEHLHVLALSA